MGGGIFILNSALEMRRSEVSGNRALTGAGVYIEGFNYANDSRILFAGNIYKQYKNTSFHSFILRRYYHEQRRNHQ